jgi:ABC-type amino acid transport substrate-binding protein
MSRILDRRSLLSTIASVVVIIATTVTAGCSSGSQKPAPASESVYDRVIRTGVIRASYTNYAPYCLKDQNSGKLSGIFVEALEEVGRRLAVRIDWTEEVGYGTIFEGLNSGRYDIFGAGVWKNATRGKVGDFSKPLMFNVIKLWGRPDEKRFTDLSALNAPDVRIATQDGAIEDVIAKSDYPKATRVSVPQLTPWSEVLLNITSKKADATFAEPAAVNIYLEKNPGSLRELAPTKPLRVFANCYAFKLGEEKFKSMLDAAVDEIVNDGTVDKILRKYEHVPGEFYRVAKPYDVPPAK